MKELFQKVFMDTSVKIIFEIAILIFSVVIHEVSHGLAAYRQGDLTAKYAGRLTLNPLKHLDPVGSFLVPLFLLASSGGQWAFGWAKPVPINPYNFRDQKYGSAKVAFSGPAANLAVALIFGMIIRFFPPIVTPETQNLLAMFDTIVIINLILMVFNLVPIPPLDGSHILFAFLPASQERFAFFLKQWGIVILIVFMLFFLGFIWPIVDLLYRVIVGSSFTL